MRDYVVDSVHAGISNGHYVGDVPNPTEEPQTHYFKKPLEERVALTIRNRAAAGWRLASTAAVQPNGGSSKVFLFFERERE